MTEVLFKIVEPKVVHHWVTPNALQAIEKAGRVCYKSEDKITDESSEKFVRMLVGRRHEAMIEHACASFILTTDRGITHELVRHRMASFAQESTRYCNYSKDKFDNRISVIEPPFENSHERDVWIQAMDVAQDAYLLLLKKGVKPQIARSVLPTCTKADIVLTTNFREWRHIMRLRTAPDAHPQIIQLIGFVREWFQENYPVIVEDLKSDWTKEG